MTRNLLKRRLREIFRQHQGLFPPEVDVVVTLQAGAAEAGFADLERQFLAAARKAGFGPADATAEHLRPPGHENREAGPRDRTTPANRGLADSEPESPRG